MRAAEHRTHVDLHRAYRARRQGRPRTYRKWRTASPSERTVTDAYVTNAILGTVGTAEGLYGRRKMTVHLRNQCHEVGKHTVDRLLRDEGLSGVVRGRRHRTTIPGGRNADRAPDLLDRNFTAEAPNRKWVTDLLSNLDRVRLCGGRDRLLLAGDRRVARGDGQGHRNGHHRVENGTVAT